MAPRQNVALYGRGNTAKSRVTSQKRSAAVPRESGKPKSQAKRRQSDDMPEESHEEDNVIIGGSTRNPIELKPPTSFAARKRRRAGLSMAEIFAESSKGEEVPTDYAAQFVAGSTALSTWGAATSLPVPAVRPERRHKGLGGFGLRRGKGSAFVKFMFGSASDPDEGGDDTMAPFRFLDLPLEIRWKIYGYLLIHPKPILMHSDWKTVHVTSPQDHTILRASKQILLESTQVLYEKNTFHAVLNPKRVSLRLKSNPMDGFIKREFLPYLRNVIIDCRSGLFNDLYKGDMIGPIASCFGTLVMGEALLDSVTLVVSPIIRPRDPVVVSDPARPTAKKPISEYFKAPASKIMRIIPKLRCKVLNIVLRMPDKRRVIVSINLRGLPANQDESGWFAGEIVAKLSARKMAYQVKQDLLGLEQRFEDILEDYEKAIMDGKARLMDDGESLADGMRLASRG